MGIIGALIVGALCGMFAGMIVKGHGFGCLGNIVVGLIGAGLFSVVIGTMDVFGNEWVNSLFGGTLGAIGLLLIVGLFTKSR